MPNTMTDDEARATWDELVAIETAHPILTGTFPLAETSSVGTIGNGSAGSEQVKPDRILAPVVGSQPLRRNDLTKKLWSYIKRNGLQDKRDRSMINADAPLKAVFGRTKVSMSEMSKLVSAHVEPLSFDHGSPKMQHGSMSDKRIYVEKRPEGDYAVRRPGAERASAIEPTQKQAIEKARELNPGVAPHVERVRDTDRGGRDKWRRP